MSGMVLPVKPFVLPSDLKGLPHGVIDKSVHVPVLIPGSGTSWMYHRAARGLAVLTARCKAETGVILGSVGMWRAIQVEEAGFKRSYLDHFDRTLCTLEHQREYQGKTWYLLKDTIPKATPGTSKHGKGCADDLAIWTGREKLGIRSSAKAWAWLKANVVDLGFSWAYAKEGVDDPHIQWFSGDVIPPAVLAFEKAHGLTPIIPQPPAAPPPGASLPVPPPPTIMSGDRGTDVVALQQHLVALGLYTGAIDGRCGPVTVEAIRGLQRLLAKAGLDVGRVDGVFGPRTRTAYLAWTGRPR